MATHELFTEIDNSSAQMIGGLCLKSQWIHSSVVTRLTAVTNKSLNVKSLKMKSDFGN